MVSRRMVLAGLGVGTAALWAAAPLRAQALLGADPGSDMTGTLQAEIDAAATGTGRLDLPPGRFFTRGLRLPSGFVLTGVPGATVLVHAGDDPLLLIEGAEGVLVSGVGFDGSGAGGERWHGGLVHVEGSDNVTLRDCIAGNTRLNAITVLDASASVETCTASDSDQNGIFVFDGRGVRVAGNHVFDCRNGGVRVWRGESGPDGTVVTGNRIRAIDWRDGGNGQNGNGINVFRADGVVVSDNAIADCTFSAIRLNATNNTVVSGNTCLNSGEVAIFSEFEFSGSAITGNVIEGAAAGISMTNYIDGGRLATCSGNIVRNIFPRSAVNPDTTPYGIAAEADAVVSGNVVEPGNGVGIAVGWGPYLRDVLVTGNMVRDADAGIVVSVAEGAGAAVVTNNMVSGARRYGIAASAWDEVQSTDLQADAGRFPQLTVAGNTVV